MDDFYFVTCFFNLFPCPERTANFHIFYENLRQITNNIFVVEAVLSGQEPILNLSENYKVVNCQNNGLWIKENLLNVAVAQLPRHCKYVAWLDCDIIFENQNIIADAKESLETNKIIQLFEHVIRLDFAGKEQSKHLSVGSGYQKGMTMTDFKKNCHTGFAWAMKKETFFELGGLFEYAIAGGGDGMMTTFILETFDSMWKNVRTPYKRCAAKTASRWKSVIAGKFGFAPGTIRHLWHGPKFLQWKEKHETLKVFRPFIDIRKNAEGIFEWTNKNPILQDKIAYLLYTDRHSSK